MSSAVTYRTCPRSGLQFEGQAEKLMIANAFVAVVFLLIGGILAIGVVLTRWPAVHWLAADTFYQVLTAHGIDMLIFWIIFFEVAVLYFCSSTLLRCRIATPKIAWLAFALMLIGAITNNVAVFQGSSSVMMTSYVPMMAAPSFYLGLILFAVGALIACFVFFGTLVIAKRDKTYTGSVPLVTFGAITAAIIAVFTITSGAIILIPTFLMSVGIVKEVDPLVYRTIWWAFGHSSQQINVAAHISIWYAVAAIAFGAKPMSERVSRGGLSPCAGDLDERAGRMSPEDPPDHLVVGDRVPVLPEERVVRVEVDRCGDEVVGAGERLRYRDAGFSAVDVHLIRLVAGLPERHGKFCPAVDGIQHQDPHSLRASVRRSHRMRSSASARQGAGRSRWDLRRRAAPSSRSAGIRLFLPREQDRGAWVYPARCGCLVRGRAGRRPAYRYPLSGTPQAAPRPSAR